jgi:Na+/H+ antiporter NhaA
MSMAAQSIRPILAEATDAVDGFSPDRLPPIATSDSSALTGRTAWARNLEEPLREFLRTETGSATVLLGAAVAALAWVNIDASSYERVWTTDLSIRIGDEGVSQDLREWVNKGLMALFFFVVGLEARREFDLGELRERRRVALPLFAGLGGMVGAVAIYLAINAGEPSAQGWGVAMSTDTALALGMLALVGRRLPERLRAFVLTVTVVDDIVALLVIATVYTDRVELGPLLIGFGFLLLVPVAIRLRVRSGLVYFALGASAWVAILDSGVDPIVTGLAMGLLAYATPPGREVLEEASDRFRMFREQPTPELALSARVGLRRAISPNERLQLIYHPWTSYLIVPVFALANAGISINAEFFERAISSPITLGIVFGYVLGKPIGVMGTSWLVTKLSRGRLRPPVGWAAVAGGGTIAGIGFTVSLLVASAAFSGDELEEAKLGVLGAALGAALLTWLVFRATELLPSRLRVRALLGETEPLVDLADPVRPERDHIRGPEHAPVTLLEYGDFECPYCGRAEEVLRELLSEQGDVRYVWRHLPLNDVHTHAQMAAEAAEAAAAQGQFWGMHDLLLDHQGELTLRDLVGYARELGLDLARFTTDLREHAGAPRIAEDVDGADLSGVTGTPTFFINGRRHPGAYDIDTLTAAVRAARARAALQESSPGRAQDQTA